jgi:hypothetical protein
MKINCVSCAGHQIILPTSTIDHSVKISRQIVSSHCVFWLRFSFVWGLDGAGSGKGKVAGTCEYGNELSGSVKRGEFLDQLQNQLASQEGLCSME